MRGGCAECAKVGGCVDQSTSKVMEPDAVDDDPCQQRILRIGQSLGQRRTSSCRRMDCVIDGNCWQFKVRRDDAESGRLEFLFRLLMVTPGKQE